MAIFQLNDEWRIASDEHAWMVQRRKEVSRDGQRKTEWRAVTWHANLEQAARDYYDRGLRLSDAEGIEAIRAVADGLEAEIREAFALPKVA